MMCIGQSQSDNHIESGNSESPSFSFSDRREMSKGFMLNHDMTETERLEETHDHLEENIPLYSSLIL